VTTATFDGAPGRAIELQQAVIVKERHEVLGREIQDAVMATRQA
jgi:hypothetical protein